MHRQCRKGWHNMSKAMEALGLRKSLEDLEALHKHQGWELLREQVLQDRHNQEGELEYKSVLRRFRDNKDRDLSANNLAGARYWQGRLDQLLEDVEGKLIRQVITELAQEG